MSLERGIDDYTFEMFVDDVYLFNDIGDAARGTSDAKLSDLKNQYKVILEEVKETGQALEENNPVKVLDGVVDTLVTVIGLVKYLEDIGMDVMGACRQVADDNLKKFPVDEEVAKASVESLLNKGVKARYVWSEIDFTGTGEAIVILDENNKVRKPITFQSTDLSRYVPSHLKEGFTYANY